MRSWLVTVALLAACGGGDDDPVAVDARPIDAEVPDAEPDRCEQLCSCLSTYCGDTSATCMSDCQALDDSVQICRVEHCVYASAPGGSEYHCPHAYGDPNGTKTPINCIQP